jgi:hypothetical protein
MLTVALCSCETDIQNGEFVVGSDYLGINNRVILVDTLTVEVSTINFDSLVTSDQKRILIGNYEDPIFGNVKSESYFQMTPDNLELDNEISNTDTPIYVYDSIAMILRYDKYYYGDTTKVQTINIHKLTQKVKPNNEDDSFYNSSALSYNSTSIGTKSFYPKPNDKDSINITLDNSFGNELFQKLKNNEVTSYDEFIDFFKGILIKPQTTTSANVIGFKTTSVLRLYYSEQNNSSEQESLFKDFEISDSNKQFNNISLNRIGTILQNLPAYNDKLSSKLTNNSSFIQSGTGVACRIDFPHIKEVKYLSDRGLIVDAELILKPVKNSYSTLFPLNDSLQVFVSDNLNRISGTLKNSDGTQKFAILDSATDEFNENIGYKINIGTFLYSEMLKTSGKKSSLIFTIPNISKGVNRIVLGNQNNPESKMKLKIYYISY